MKSHFWTSEKRQVFDDIYREFDIRFTDSKIGAEYPDSQKFTGMLTASSQEFTGTHTFQLASADACHPPSFGDFLCMLIVRPGRSLLLIIVLQESPVGTLRTLVDWAGTFAYSILQAFLTALNPLAVQVE
jgi:hypothetical protein